MATLTENANRIKNGAADIKDWILAQGVTPTGNIETFRAALDGIDIPKLAVGVFADTNGANEITIDFKPSMVIVELNYDATAYPIGYISYVDGVVRNCMLTSLNAGRIQPNTVLNITVDNNIITVTTAIATFVGKNCRYIAIG